MSRISRRSVLRGLGVAVGLPFLDAMMPGTVLNAAQAAGTTATGAAVAQTHMGFFFIPNGVNIPYWTPTKEGFDFDLTPTPRASQGSEKRLHGAQWPHAGQRPHRAMGPAIMPVRRRHF